MRKEMRKRFHNIRLRLRKMFAKLKKADKDEENYTICSPLTNNHCKFQIETCDLAFNLHDQCADRDKDASLESFVSSTLSVSRMLSPYSDTTTSQDLEEKVFLRKKNSVRSEFIRAVTSNEKLSYSSVS